MLHSRQPVDQQLETISTLIRKAIAPDSWSEHGGLATLKIYSSNRAMVVTQYPSELEKIDKLLGSLEKLANNRTSKIEYDVSAIIDLDSSKPVDDQLEAICTMLDRRFPKQAFIPLELAKDPDGASIVASTNEQGHAAIKAFLDQLRHSREAVAEIDR
jgi:type II secretory pathway component GspD/PulD (secretin)